MELKKFTNDCKRMMDSYGRRSSFCCGVKCDGCPLQSLCSEHSGVGGILLESIDKLEKIVQKWVEEHPIKTYKDVFLQQVPDALLKPSGYPEARPCTVYCFQEVEAAFGNCLACDGCKQLWDRPYTKK